MVDNRKLIVPLLEFPNEHSFYFVQVLQRNKDVPTIEGNNSRVIKTYYITSVEKLDKLWEEITGLAEFFNARVCINLNPRNFRKAAFSCLQKIANQMANEDFKNIPYAYNSVCGEYHSEIDKRWIVDVDKEDLPNLHRYEAIIKDLQYDITNKNYNILAKVPSKSGMHIITNPFNLATFKQFFPHVEIHKNNPTNLYIP